jgi:hypothetical protein
VRLRISIEAEVDDDQVPRMAEWLAEQKVMGLDPGPGEAVILGRFAGAVEVFAGQA